MERLLRLDAFWSWLPAFRAVGETQHLPTAALALHVSPSALSRSVRLLERQLGCQLFERQARSLVLTSKGRQFLAAVRTAMRQLDDAVEELNNREPHGQFRVASVTAVLTSLVAPELRQMSTRHPELRPELLTKVGQAVPRLLAGELDVAFLHEGANVAGIHAELLTLLPRNVYCGADHPLTTQPSVTQQDLAGFDFVTASADPLGLVNDGWPPDWPRRIGMQTDQLLAGCELCLGGTTLMVLPDLLADHLGNRLHRLPVTGCLPIELHALRRTGETLCGRPDARLITAVRERLRQAQTNEGSPGNRPVAAATSQHAGAETPAACAAEGTLLPCGDAVLLRGDGGPHRAR